MAIGAIGAIGVLMAALGFAATAQAAFPGANGKIAFEGGFDGSSEPDIYVMDPDGSDPTQLTTFEHYDTSPAWSADGGKIAFVRHHVTNDEIYVMNADGSGQTQLTTHPEYDQDPTWSPDGTKIAFVSYRDHPSGHIYVMNADGSGQTQLTSAVGGRSPAWSPDGSKIVFDAFDDIWVMNADGSGQTKLTTNPGYDFEPVWSPDGSMIAFTRQADVTVGNSEIHVMNADGSGNVALTADPAWDRNPAWSPDGSKIAFDSVRSGNNLDIWVMDADGSGPVNLTSSGSGEANPDWQPAPPSPDAVPPTIDLVSPADGADYLLGESVLANYSCADEVGGSGLASCAGPVADGAEIDTSSVGSKSFTVAASDNAGNTSSTTNEYRVVYDFAGFYSPVDNPPAVNRALAGEVIPVRFSLGGDQGLDILASGSPRSSRIDCATGAVVGASEPTDSVDPGLTYSHASERYTYRWKTDRDWGRTCRQLDVELTDGTHHVANFKFRQGLLDALLGLLFP